MGGSVFCSPGSWKKGGMSCGALGPTPHCVIHGDQLRNGQALSPGGQGQLGPGWPGGSCILQGLG